MSKVLVPPRFIELPQIAEDLPQIAVVIQGQPKKMSEVPSQNSEVKNKGLVNCQIIWEHLQVFWRLTDGNPRWFPLFLRCSQWF